MAGEKLDPKNLTGPQKAAVFLLTMGERYTSDIFQKMSEDEIKKVATIMASIDQIPATVMSSVVKEFVANFEDENRMVVKPETFLKNAIGETLDKQKAQSIFKEIEDRKRDRPFVWSRDVDVARLKEHIEGEHPQTIAMILAHLPPEIASEILVSISDEKKGDIALRIAQLSPVSDEIIRDVDQTLRAELSEIGRAGSEEGGLQALVNILNGVDRSTEDLIMEAIEEEDEDLAIEIREKMFVFEDLVEIDDRGMREILKNVESKELVLAMKTASEELKQKILNNLSSRAAEMLLEDLQVMGPVRLAEVEAAQQAIIRSAKDLESQGTIVLGGKGKEDVLV
ncbi:MAG TPA: flagellar motor switch protein FliG [Desulfobacterales bacterium]|nr:flagellar motor switch protein FliG [Desulfobacterales bacterium]